MISRGALLRSLKDWTGWLRQTAESLVDRDSARFPEDMGLALTGVRRCGKTYMAVEMAKRALNSTFYYNFEDPILSGESNSRIIDTLISLFEEEYETKPSLVILDEVHDVKDWEKWVRKAIDLKRHRIVVTGSSSKLLSSEIATALSGRVLEKNVWPLSFAEFLLFKEQKPASEARYLRELGEFLVWGGFPRVVLSSDKKEKTLILKQYLNDIVFRDVIGRHAIRETNSLHQLVGWYSTNMSCLHSYNAVRKAFGISIQAASTLTGYLSGAYLFFEMHRYHPNLKIQARDPKKVYTIDNGLRTVSLRSEREDWGRLAENAVYIELRRRGKEISYFREKHEVDFVITELGRPVEAIQVCYSDMSNPDTRNRETHALWECLEFLKIRRGVVLTLNFEDRIKKFGRVIEFLPLYRWLISC